MSLTMSVSTAQMLGMGCSFQEMFGGGEMQLRGGTISVVDLVSAGSLVATLTLASAARTAEVQATAVIELAGASGSVDAITIDGYEVLGAVVPFNTSLTQTAADVASQINRYTRPVIKIWATSSGAVITLRACPGQGTSLNTLAIVCTTSTLTNTINGASADQMGIGAGGSVAGVASANGLTLAEFVAGVVSILGSWQGNVLLGSTAVTHVRLEGCNTPTGTSPADATATPAYRIQFNTVGVTGADFNMPGGTTLVAGTPFNINTGTFTIPRS